VKADFDAKTRMNSWFGAIFSLESLKIGLFMDWLSENPYFYWCFEAREIRVGEFSFWLKKIVSLNIHGHPSDLIGSHPSLFTKKVSLQSTKILRQKRKKLCDFIFVQQRRSHTELFHFTSHTIPVSYGLRSMRRRFRSTCGGMAGGCGTIQKYSQTSNRSSSSIIRFIRSNCFKLTVASNRLAAPSHPPGCNNARNNP
jgi:hypothetical protein